MQSEQVYGTSYFNYKLNPRLLIYHHYTCLYPPWSINYLCLSSNNLIILDHFKTLHIGTYSFPTFLTAIYVIFPSKQLVKRQEMPADVDAELDVIVFWLRNHRENIVFAADVLIIWCLVSHCCLIFLVMDTGFPLRM